MRVLALLGSAGCLAGSSVMAGAQSSVPGGGLSGFWQLESQTAPASPQFRSGQRPVGAAGLDAVAAKPEDLNWCVVQGVPYVMKDAGPIDIIQGPTEVLISAERVALQRHIYLDRRTHPDPDVFDNSPVGNSYGVLAGGELTVDTVGLNEGVGPAGIPRTDKTHLVERMRVAGDTLTVDGTWSDPGVLARPYIYVLTYKRLPADYQPVEYRCDARKNGVVK